MLRLYCVPFVPFLNHRVIALQLLLGGYIPRCVKSREAIIRLHDQIDQSSIELATFQRLRENEQKAIPARTDALTEDVAVQALREKNLQVRFQHLTMAKEHLLQTKALHAATTCSQVTDF